MNTKDIASLKSAVWFIVKLNILAIPFFLITYYGYSIPEFQNIWAAALGQSISSFGYETATSDHTVGVKVENTIHQIGFSWDSTGWKSLYALTALVFASGVGTLRNKLRFLAFGLPLIIFVNLLRVVTTILFALKFGFQYFDFVHTFLWSVLMVLFVIGVWYYLFFRKR